MSDIQNPLAQIARNLGLNLAQTARLAGVAPSAARQALLETNPCGAVDAYIRISAALGATQRLRVAKPFEIRISQDRLDELYFDDGFRQSRELPKLPKNRQMLRRVIARMQTRRYYKPYKGIVAYLQGGHVCTPEGYWKWRKGQVGQILKNRRKQRVIGDVEPLKPNEVTIGRWRSYLLDNLLPTLCPDPMAPMRYGMTPKVCDREIVLATGERMPETVKAWMLEGMSKTPWLIGAWSFADVAPRARDERLPTGTAPESPLANAAADDHQ